MMVFNNKDKILKLLSHIVMSLTLLAICFCVSKPIQANAEGIQWSVDGRADTYVYIPNYIYWGGSENRTGLLFYCVDKASGKLVPGTKTVLYNKADAEGENEWMSMVEISGYTRVGHDPLGGDLMGVSWSVSTILDTSLRNTGDWTESTDISTIKTWLEGDSEMTYKGKPVCKAASLVYNYCGEAPFKKLYSEDYSVCFEGMYGIAKYRRENGNDIALSFPEKIVRDNYPELFNADGTPVINEGSTDEQKKAFARATVRKFFEPLKEYALNFYHMKVDITTAARYDDNGTANSKWLQSCAKYFKTDEDHFGVPAASKSGGDVKNLEAYETGWNFAVINMKAPPIHTYWEPYGTPGNTEPPDPEIGTDGECTIKKLYHTQTVSADGTLISDVVDGERPYVQGGTTAYIVIDPEEGCLCNIYSVTLIIANTIAYNE